MSLPPLVPARILNEHVYCPRLAYLEWVDQRFEDNADTAHGTFVHRRVHDEQGAPPEPRKRPAATGEHRRQPLVRGARPDRQGRPARAARRDRRPDRIQAWPPAFGRRAAVGARARPAVCPGPPLAGGGVPRRACGGVLRRDQDPAPHPGRRRARRADALRPRRAPCQRRSRRAPSPAGRQPQVPAVLACRDLPARRGQRPPRASREYAPPTHRRGFACLAALRDDAREQSVEARRPRRPTGGPKRGRLAAVDRRLTYRVVRQRRCG